MGFPVIATIDDVLLAVRGRDEFVVAEREWGTVIDYQITLPDSFTGPDAALRAECRGIKFRQDGTLLARPYHKFHNFGEPQMQVADLAAAGRFHEHFIILDKLDGSMIHPIVDWTDTLRFCTRMGVTDVATNAYEYAARFSRIMAGKQPWYLDFCYDLSTSGLTPMFEWCSRKNRIVLDYPDDQLILTAIRKNDTGEYLTWRKMRVLADPYNIPMVGHWDGEWDDIHAFLDMVHDIEESEGYVLRWDDGTMGKSKGQWYLQIHKAKDHISHEKRVIGLILNDNLDDVMPFLLPMDYDRVVAYRDDFWDKVAQAALTLESVVDIAKTLPREMGLFDEDRQPEGAREAKKMFATTVIPGYKGALSDWKGMLFAVWDGADPRKVVMDKLRKDFALDVVGAKRNGSDTIVQELRDAHLLPEKDWRDY